MIKTGEYKMPHKIILNDDDFNANDTDFENNKKDEQPEFQTEKINYQHESSQNQKTYPQEKATIEQNKKNTELRKKILTRIQEIQSFINSLEKKMKAMDELVKTCSIPAQRENVKLQKCTVESIANDISDITEKKNEAQEKFCEDIKRPLDMVFNEKLLFFKEQIIHGHLLYLFDKQDKHFKNEIKKIQYQSSYSFYKDVKELYYGKDKVRIDDFMFFENLSQGKNLKLLLPEEVEEHITKNGGHVPIYNHFLVQWDEIKNKIKELKEQLQNHQKNCNRIENFNEEKLEQIKKEVEEKVDFCFKIQNITRNSAFIEELENILEKYKSFISEFENQMPHFVKEATKSLYWTDTVKDHSPHLNRCYNMFFRPWGKRYFFEPYLEKMKEGENEILVKETKLKECLEEAANNTIEYYYTHQCMIL